jgi:hypothetical protein
MPLCPNGQKAIITWQYPGEDKQQILGADDYTLSQEKGKCNTLYLIGGVAAKNGVDYCETPNLNNNWGFSVQGPIHGIQAKYIRTDDRYNCPDYKRIVGKAKNYLAYVSYGSNLADERYSIIYFYEPHTFDTVVRVNYLVRADGLPDNCGGCVFKVTKNGQVVYSKTAPQCPIVTHTCGEQCPAGSCECTCDTEVCCYHPTTGKVIKSFIR